MTTNDVLRLLSLNKLGLNEQQLASILESEDGSIPEELEERFNAINSFMLPDAAASNDAVRSKIMGSVLSMVDSTINDTLRARPYAEMLDIETINEIFSETGRNTSGKVMKLLDHLHEVHLGKQKELAEQGQVPKQMTEENNRLRTALQAEQDKIKGLAQKLETERQAGLMRLVKNKMLTYLSSKKFNDHGDEVYREHLINEKILKPALGFAAFNYDEEQNLLRAVSKADASSAVYLPTNQTEPADWKAIIDFHGKDFYVKNDAAERQKQDSSSSSAASNGGRGAQHQSSSQSSVDTSNMSAAERRRFETAQKNAQRAKAQS